MKTIKKSIIGLVFILSSFLSNAQWDTAHPIINTNFAQAFFYFNLDGVGYNPTAYIFDPGWTNDTTNGTNMHPIFPATWGGDGITSFTVSGNTFVTFIDTIYGFSLYDSIKIQTVIYLPNNEPLVITLSNNDNVTYTINTTTTTDSVVIDHLFA